jgi:hypothetical protein
LYAPGGCWHLHVKFSLTFSSAFLILKDLRRNRLAAGLTRAAARSNPWCCEEKGPNGTPTPPPVLQLFRLRASVNSRSQNIFNGFLRVPVNEKNSGIKFYLMGNGLTIKIL